MRYLLLLSLLAFSCGDTGALVVVTVSSSATISPTALTGTITLGGTVKPFNLPVTTSIPPDFVFGIELPASATGLVAVSITTVGLTDELSQSGSVMVNPHARADIAIALGPQVISDMAVPPADLFDRDALPIFTRKYVISNVALSVNDNDYQYDLDGNGTAENGYGRVVVTDNGAIGGPAIDQPVVNQSITAGNQLALIRLQSTDSTFANDGVANTTLFAGNMQMPKLDGTDILSVDATIPAVALPGALVSGSFSSIATKLTTVPNTAHFKLSVLGLLAPVTMVGMHISYTVNGSGLMAGQINGAIPQERLLNETLPAVVLAMNQAITANPSAPNSMTFLSIFDTGNPNGSCDGGAGHDLSACQCGVAGDKVIELCEISLSALFAQLFANDVDLYDAAMMFKPDPSDTSPDSFSVGFGFTAVPATF